jgi:ribose transport system ATP-binding protein
VTAALLETHGIVTAFPGVRAFDGVDLVVRPGDVHCPLGQNGAGTSTLIKVLAGAHQPDAGTITGRGEQVSLSDPQAAMSLGIATIYQELDLVAGLAAADDILLSRDRSRFGLARPDLVTAIAKGEDPVPSSADGLRVQRVLDAVGRSAADRSTWTDIPA